MKVGWASLNRKRLGIYSTRRFSIQAKVAADLDFVDEIMNDDFRSRDQINYSLRFVGVDLQCSRTGFTFLSQPCGFLLYSSTRIHFLLSSVWAIHFSYLFLMVYYHCTNIGRLSRGVVVGLTELSKSRLESYVHVVIDGADSAATGNYWDVCAAARKVII